jgi:uridine kinase
MKQKKPIVIAIDGHSGTGKTTIAKIIARDIGGYVIHADALLYSAALAIPEKMRELYGNYPSYATSGLACLGRDGKITVENERCLFNSTRDYVEREIESIVAASRSPIIVIDYITSNKFKRLWKSANLRIMVDSDPKPRAVLLTERVLIDEKLTQPNVTQIREEAFAPMLKNPSRVDLNIYNNYDLTLNDKVQEIYAALKSKHLI